MRTEFRNRVFLPVFLPVAIVLGVVGLVVGFAFILLYNTREAALVTALVAAAGILVAVALAATRDRLEGSKKAAVIGAGTVPIIVGGIFAIPAVSGVDPSLLNINRQPHLVIPDDAPLLAADSIDGFCLPTDGGCELIQEWEVTPSEETEQFAYVFDNLDQGVAHNLALFTVSEGAEGVDQKGDEILVPPPFPGVGTEAYVVEDEVPSTFFFQCTVHPSTMWGIGTIVGAEDAEA